MWLLKKKKNFSLDFTCFCLSNFCIFSLTLCACVWAVHIIYTFFIWAFFSFLFFGIEIDRHQQNNSTSLTSCTNDYPFSACHFLTTTKMFSISWYYCHKSFFCLPLQHELVIMIFFACFTPYMSNKKSTQTYTISQDLAAPNSPVSMCLCPITLCISFFPSFSL